MFPWMNPWFEVFKAPLSGNVTQDISPVTSWFSPQLEFNFAGNKAIESQVVSEVASYGKQLGILSRAVIEMAEGRQSQALKDLKVLSLEVEKVKQNHKENVETKTRWFLDELKKHDPESFKKILNEYLNNNT
ncbi:MAG: hypothetical protein MI865_03755 [Proteobacteria bacterium]|nr:hypothetical protein [Pseudomonadota bacterium]